MNSVAIVILGWEHYFAFFGQEKGCIVNYILTIYNGINKVANTIQ